MDRFNRKVNSRGIRRPSNPMMVLLQPIMEAKEANIAAEAVTLEMNIIIELIPSQLVFSSIKPNEKSAAGSPGVMKGRGSDTMTAQAETKLMTLIHKRIGECVIKTSPTLMKKINAGILKS